MSVIYILFGALIGGLILIYMVRPAFTRVRLSAARFFEDDPKTGASVLRVGRPSPTRSFFLQLFVVLALLAAVILFHLPSPTARSRQAGVWFIVDESASMSTLHGNSPRMDLALAELRRIAEVAGQSGSRVDPCFDLSTFDLQFRDVQRNIRGIAALSEAARLLKPRPLGTDLTLVQQAVNRVDGAPSGCMINQVVIISDMPAPAWMSGSYSSGVVWRDISQPVGNIGVTDVTSIRDPFSGNVEKARFQIQAFGPGIGAVRLTVTRPDGTSAIEQELQSGRERTWAIDVPTDLSGRYRLKLSPGGAYAYDDEVEIEVPKSDAIRADWRVGRHELLSQLGWRETSVDPDVRVLPASGDGEGIPAILVGAGFLPRQPLQPIWAFWGISPLLSSLNFDVAERVGMQPVRSLPKDFIPVLTGPTGAVWIAQRETPRSAYVPGLPSMGDDTLARFSTTLFMNAARWVLNRRKPAALFRLTSPDELEPKGNLLALHPGEGNTELAPVSVGTLDFQRHTAAPTQARKRQFWPYLVLAALGVFLVERRQAFFGGPEWK
jgi:hypothetical protein